MTPLAAEPLFQFLVALACGAPDSVLGKKWKAIPPSFPAEEMVRFAARFALVPALGLFASSNPVVERDLARRLVAGGLFASQSREAALQLLKDLLSLAPAPAGLPIVIKGAALAIGWGIDQRRFFVDADLLIPSDQLAVWVDAAKESGAEVTTFSGSGYELAHVLRGRGFLEIHAALAGAGGSEWGPGYAEVAAASRQVKFGSSDLLVPRTIAAREIAVHHFAFHHNGEPLHAMRTLQDLALLEGEEDGTPLPWKGLSPRAPVERLRRIVRSVREDRVDANPEAVVFLTSLLEVASGEEAGATHFSDAVDHWMESRKEEGRSRTMLALSRLFPPLVEMRKPGDSSLVVFGRYLLRPAMLFGRYLRGSLPALLHSRRRKVLQRWRAYLRRQND